LKGKRQEATEREREGMREEKRREIGKERGK